MRAAIKARQGVRFPVTEEVRVVDVVTRKPVAGDVAVVHPDGYIEIKDRLKAVIISGGENISSVDVENMLCRHPAIAAGAVVARPDEQWGETPSAFVELKPGMAASEDEIIAHCRHHLAGFKMPRHVVFGDRQDPEIPAATADL